MLWVLQFDVAIECCVQNWSVNHNCEWKQLVRDFVGTFKKYRTKNVFEYSHHTSSTVTNCKQYVRVLVQILLLFVLVRVQEYS